MDSIYAVFSPKGELRDIFSSRKRAMKELKSKKMFIIKYTKNKSKYVEVEKIINVKEKN